MKRSLSFFYPLIILWALPAAGEDGLLGTWEAVEEGGIEVTSVEEDGTLHRQTLEGETSLRATFAEDNSCQFDIKMRFYDVAMSQVLFGGGADEVNLVRLVEIATAVDLVTDDQLDAWRQRVDDALARLHADSMTLAWMGTYSAEGNSLQMDFDEGALYLGDIEAVEFFINFFAEELGSDELSDDLVEWITSIFGGTPERGWAIAANISSDSGNLVFSFPGPDGTFPGPDDTANTLELARISTPTAVAPISWGDLKDRW